MILYESPEVVEGSDSGDPLSFFSVDKMPVATVTTHSIKNDSGKRSRAEMESTTPDSNPSDENYGPLKKPKYS